MNKKFFSLIILLLFFTLFPITNDLFLINVFSIAFIFSVYASSWDLLSGFTGKENFGHAAFIAIGGYLVGFMSSSFHINPFLSLALSAIAAALFGAIIGIPTLRLRGPYFALATLAVASIMEKLTISYSNFTGGEEGIYGIPFLTESPITSYYFVLAFSVISIIIMYFIGKSNFGLILKSLKSDELASQALGIRINYYKISAFVISSLFAGMGGSITAHFFGYIGPDIVYPLSLNSIIMAVVGGIGGIIPAALGGLSLTIISELLSDFGDFNLLLYTIILILSILFLPEGIFNTLSNKLLIRKGERK